MPIYRFHVEIPAAPGEVAERLRAVVQRPLGFWDSLLRRPNPRGRAFAGSVWDDSFSLRPNLGSFRNWSSPRIRGNITSCAGVTRMAVTTFINPTAWVFILAWILLARYRLGAPYTGNQFVLIIRLGIVFLALPLGLLRFFRESRQSRVLLCTAIRQPVAAAATQSAGVRPIPFDTGPPQGNLRRVAAAVALAVVLICAFGFLVHRKQLRDCPAVAASLALVSASPEARAALGDSVEQGSIRGVVHQSPESGYALLSIPLHGSKGRGTLHVVANRTGDHWDLERVALWSYGNTKRLDLTPPTLPERFRYPARGVVYLVPFDTAAAAVISDIPPYLAARLGIRASILPVLDPGPEAIDPATHQLIAERAYDAMLRISGPPAEDVDAVFVGVSSTDLRIQATDWGFATSYLGGRMSVLSTARFGEMAWMAGANPEAMPARVRKLVTRNVASLRFPVAPSADPTSALAAVVSGADDADEMSEEFLGGKGSWSPAPGDAPCFSILQGPNGRQGSRLGCANRAPLDSRFEAFENFTAHNLLVLSHTDLSLDSRGRAPFVRKYRPRDSRSRSFGIGANNSYDIFPVGDSRTFSAIDLILEDGARAHFERISRGSSYADARLRSLISIGSPFSLSDLAWNGNGWDLTTPAGWVYRFPSSGPGRSPEQSALVRMQAGADVISLQRDAQGSLQRAESSDGQAIDFTVDSQRRVTRARHSSGRSIQYEYDDGGRLVRVRDSQAGEERYQYDALHRLTAVFNAEGRRMLSNTYGDGGEITSQTLADGRTLHYSIGVDNQQETNMVSFLDENGYVTEWRRSPDGFYATLPRLARALP